MQKPRGFFLLFSALALLLVFGAERLNAGSSFDHDVGALHVKLESGNANISGTTAALTGTVSIWPKGNSALKLTVRNANISISGNSGGGPVTAAASGGGPMAASASAATNLTPDVNCGRSITTAGGYTVTIDASCTKATIRDPKGKESTTNLNANPGDLGKTRVFVLPDGTRISFGTTGGESRPKPSPPPMVWIALNGTGAVDVNAGPVTLTFSVGTFQSGGAGLAITGPQVPVQGCDAQAGPGSEVSAAGVLLKGTLKCGNVALVNSSLRLTSSGGLSGTGQLQSYGHTFDITYATAGNKLNFTTNWNGGGRGWQKVPGESLAEFQVTTPCIKLAFNGAALTSTFSGEKLMVRSTAKKADNTPVAQVEAAIPPLAISAGSVNLSFPQLPQPADVNKASRESCRNNAPRVWDPPPPYPPGTTKQSLEDARNRALSICDQNYPLPPAVPQLGGVKTVSVGLVIG